MRATKAASNIGWARIKRLWTNSAVEHMNRTIKVTTI